MSTFSHPHEGIPSALAHLAADWDIGVCRYYLVDYDGGDDSNQGYVDAAVGSTIDPTGKALKTIERLFQIFPKYGNGRISVIMLKPRATGATYKKQDGTTDDRLDFSGVTGYRYLLRRGSTDLTNSPSDRILCGAMIGASGPNADESWTCGAGGTTADFSVAAGSLPAEPGIIGMRVRFKGNVTAALANVCVFINGNTSAQITVGISMATAPAAGDEFFIERPGVRVATYKEAAAGEPARPGPAGEAWALSGLQAAGLCITNGAAAAFSGGAVVNTTYSFIECSGNSTTFNVMTASMNVANTFYSPSYVNEAGASILLGVGFRQNVGLQFSCPGTVTMQSIATLHPSAGFVVACGGFTIGHGGSYFARTPNLTAKGAVVSPPIFGRLFPATERRTRVAGGTFIFAMGEMNIKGLDISNTTGVAALVLASQSAGSIQFPLKHCKHAIDDIVGTGNAGVGIDASGVRGGYIQLGREIANTVTGSVGDVKVGGGVVAAHGDFTVNGFVDQNGTTFVGTANNLVMPTRIVTNRNGGPLTAGDIVRSNGTSGEVVAARADSSPNASGPLLVLLTSPADNAMAVAAPLTAAPAINFTSPPATGAMAYLSEATAGKATTVVPPVAGTNQKRRLGHTFIVDLANARGQLAGSPELLAANSDGAA